MNRDFLATTANRRKVYYRNPRSHAALHFKDTPGLKEAAIRAVESLHLETKDLGTQVDLGHEVGKCDVVETTPDDQIVYGVRNGRPEDGLVPFVKGREGDPTSSVALHLIQQDDGTYDLSSSWFGVYDGDDEPFPQSPDATDRSIDYWNHHAFVYGSQAIEPGTETTQRPW